MTAASVFEFDTLTVDVYGQTQEQRRLSAPHRIDDLGQGIMLELVAVPGGNFRMGAPNTEEGWHPSQTPQHTVTIAPFWMGKYPVTQAQWSVVAALPKVNHPLPPKPSCFTGATRPVEQVSWQDAIEFCDRVSAQTGRRYRLPTEAEWEYACRASPMPTGDIPVSEDVRSTTSTTPFWFGETITTELANYSGIDWEYEGKVCSKGSYGKGTTGSDRRETTAVGSFAIANAFGLYDMHGLVREWCVDCWHDSYNGAPADGTAWIENSTTDQRVLRGGSWNSGPKACRSAFRSKLNPDTHLYDVGFRVVAEG
ncbi:formylglycine-generating enzyme family protein [Leptolyngbya sp. FACHB-321]|uniref:formylglycine-generating enzyme family protein n=1 Tax=Leptolyngbya sp. FACHB-321 TaxID=2692807 RepID=UPI00168453CC|nr:formylglycine-generating enzyme family protein [Leptolyngbya sp. FACHB-321]MBD2035188.1 formylglycine-generating enzyme family protein [Leptolyngbya sp. FACHB-321]